MSRQRWKDKLWTADRHGPDAMDAVTTDAGCNARFSRLQQFAVHARVVFTLLIDPQRRIKSLHQVRVAMTLATVGGNIALSLVFPKIPCSDPSPLPWCPRWDRHHGSRYTKVREHDECRYRSVLPAR